MKPPIKIHTTHRGIVIYVKGPLFRYWYLTLERDVFTKYIQLAQKKFTEQSITDVFDNEKNLKRTMGDSMVEYLKGK